MPKAASPGSVSVEGTEFSVDALPDVFDARDLDYRPRLQTLPRSRDRRPQNYLVRAQRGNSCTGHALAAVIDAVLAAGGTAPASGVSARMLYRFARRFDEFEGESDVGSSLRGALKAWMRHGVLPDDAWDADDDAGDELMELRIETDPTLAAQALQCPLGAFYRVNALHLDDMHSAIEELYGIVASAAVHAGWSAPVTRRLGDNSVRHVIERDGAAYEGGHAFAIVGYNAVGFLVQNSWGTSWGKGGFATLPYDDWLDAAYDAWVARPGVPTETAPRHGSTTMHGVGTARRLVETAGLDTSRLINHVVNLGNAGQLSTSGGFRSSPAQLDRIFAHMGAIQETWTTRHVVLYAHGGLNNESTGLAIASKHLDWWLANGVYPITFAWQTGAGETLTNILADLVNSQLPFGWSPGDLVHDLTERLDRAAENAARTAARPLWDEMKENAGAASRAGGGAALTVERLHHYVRTHDAVRVHLVGHSAGSIFLAGVLGALVAADVPVTSLTYLAAAIRTDSFLADVFPRLEEPDGPHPRFASFGMTDTWELDDTCAASGVTFYRKSLLYLISRALERPTPARQGGTSTEVPLVGMQRFASTSVAGTSLEQAAHEIGGTLLWSPSTAGAPADSRTASSSHGGFDDDPATLTSTLNRILRNNN